MKILKAEDISSLKDIFASISLDLLSLLLKILKIWPIQKDVFDITSLEDTKDINSLKDIFAITSLEDTDDNAVINISV